VILDQLTAEHTDLIDAKSWRAFSVSSFNFDCYSNLFQSSFSLLGQTWISCQYRQISCLQNYETGQIFKN